MARRMLDISVHQDTFHAEDAKLAGVQAVMCRCAYGTSQDKRVDTFAPAVKAAGLDLYMYGFLTAHYGEYWSKSLVKAEEQAAVWVKIAKQYGVKVVAVDVELEPGKVSYFSKSQMTSTVNAAVKVIRDSGLVPAVYASASWYTSRFDWEKIDAYMWPAYWTDPDDSPDFPLNQWGDLMYKMFSTCKLFAWQHSNSGDGEYYGAGSDRVDLNWLYYTETKGDEKMFTVKIGPCSAGDVKTVLAKADALTCTASADENGLVTVVDVDSYEVAEFQTLAASLILPIEVSEQSDETGVNLSTIETRLDELNAVAVEILSIVKDYDSRARAAGAALKGGE